MLGDVGYIVSEVVRFVWGMILDVALALAVTHIVTHWIGEKRLEAFSDIVIEALTGFPVFKKLEASFQRNHLAWNDGRAARLRAWRVSQIGEQKMREYDALSTRANRANREASDYERAEAAGWVGNGFLDGESRSWFAEENKCREEMEKITRLIESVFVDLPEPIPPKPPALARLEAGIFQVWLCVAFMLILLGYFWLNPWHWSFGHDTSTLLTEWDEFLGLGVPLLALPACVVLAWTLARITMQIVVWFLKFLGWFMSSRTLQTASYMGAIIEVLKAVIEHMHG